MKILLTGAAGFIGSHVAQRLIARGDMVVGVDNFNDYYDPKRKWANIRPLDGANGFLLLPMDIGDFRAAFFAEHRFDAIIHLAAMPGVRNSLRDPDLYFQVNLNASRNLISLARQFDVRNFVFASTSSIYGNANRLPFVESDVCSLPTNPYAASKWAVEKFGREVDADSGFNFIALRLFSVYGPGGRPDMMPSLVANSICTGCPVPLFQGDFHRDWTFVSDISDGIVAAVDRPLGFEIINLGRGKPESLTDFVKQLEREAGARANLVFASAPDGEVQVTVADNSKARLLLDFVPQVPMELGIKLFWEWHCHWQARR